jgi:hypothetical protein
MYYKLFPLDGDGDSIQLLVSSKVVVDVGVGTVSPLPFAASRVALDWISLSVSAF